MSNNFLLFLIVPAFCFGAMTIAEYVYVYIFDQSITRRKSTLLLLAASILAFVGGLLFTGASPTYWNIASDSAVALACFCVGFCILVFGRALPMALMNYGVVMCFIAGVLSKF